MKDKPFSKYEVSEEPAQTPDPRSVSRRKFFKVAAIAVGATGLACCSLGYAATREPAIDFPEPLSCGGSSQGNGKILITYASACGSTAEIAHAIAQEFCDNAATVDVCSVEDVKNIDDYRTVILGSAVRMGTWLPKAVKFLEKNLDALEGKTIAFFTVHTGNLGDDAASQQARQEYLTEAHNLVIPQAETFFAGAVSLNKLSLMYRLFFQSSGEKDCDLRDWDLIRAWAKEMQATLKA